MKTSFNKMLNAPKQKLISTYIIAGSDRALLTSQEAPEDEPALGLRPLYKAPFVAGKLDFCLKHLDVFPLVLLGFIPVHMARSVHFTLNMLQRG
ncbi:glucokinase regulatory protein-like [Carassius gibelio]|uniref:glucokinase regulatory protein-like n=1 Tax=Carassius gibelio TaxID=101364 RepID=UPI002278E3E5|nr:glucokinase regulatory protein-like [Carassius gibelio]